MKSTESGKDKIKKICDILRKETLDPAKSDAEKIIDDAKSKAEAILADAERKAKKKIDDASLEIEKQKSAFQSSLAQACRQSIEVLKQSFEDKLFNPELSHLLTKEMQDPKVIARLIEAVINAIEKEGTDSDLSVYIPAAVPAKAINSLLAQHILDRLKEKSVLLGTMAGGASVKLHKSNITIDISDSALKELVASYIRKDFRELLLGEKAT